MESEFSTDDNGSCRLSACNTALCGEKKNTNMNEWYAVNNHPRAAREEDCKFMCDARAWCVESEFSTEDNGSCRLSTCKAMSLSVYLLGEMQRHNNIFLAFAVLFVLAAACLGDRRLSAKKSAKSSL